MDSGRHVVFRRMTPAEVEEFQRKAEAIGERWHLDRATWEPHDWRDFD